LVAADEELASAELRVPFPRNDFDDLDVFRGPGCSDIKNWNNTRTNLLLFEAKSFQLCAYHHHHLPTMVRVVFQTMKSIRSISMIFENVIYETNE
jgi:hypothetical protein